MSRKSKKNQFTKKIIELLIIGLVLILGYLFPSTSETIGDVITGQTQSTVLYNLSDIPEYNGKPYVEINNNIPFFTEEDYTTKTFEKYSELDDIFGRCGVAYANICKEIMPEKNEKRESLSYEPTGWEQEKYAGLVDGDYLYNRCHLIGWQLAGENDNKLNLITGTRYMNVEGMLPFEDMVDDYIEEHPNNHVLYRVTPIFEGNNMVASGVQMEAYSVEDNGNGVCFNVYVYNVQPGIVINYQNGDSWVEEKSSKQ